VNLLGIESAETPRKVRQEIWKRLAGDLKPPLIEEMQHITTLEKIPDYMDDILEGETSGRVVAHIADA